jgi:4,5-dihydroxyphthalate decarboxylase
MSLRLTLACGDYDINRALVSGEVPIQGVDLVALTMSSPERHWRLLRHQEFDICELSLASYLAMRDRRAQAYVAVPVFPHRRFRHSYLFVYRDAGIGSARDLEGRAVGLRTWQTTAGLWTRGILQDHYAVDIRSIDWVCQDEEDIPIDPATQRGFRLRRVAPGQDVDRMLVQGEIAALMYPDLPPSFRAGDARIQRLFPDAKAEEQRFFRSTGIFPIMHTVVIREALLERYPWLAMNVVQAFRCSKDRAWKQMEDPRRVSLAWFREALEEQREILGSDPWPYDLANNRKALGAICRYAFEQALTSRQLSPEEVFFPASLDDPPQYVGG